VTGGKRRYTDWDHYQFDLALKRRRTLPLTSEEHLADRAMAAWAKAARFRHVVQRDLRSHDLTFAQWRVLDAVDRLVRESGDAVSQQDLATRTAMDENTVSAVMRRLLRKSHVSFDFDAWEFSYRLLLTSSGAEAVHEGRRIVVRAAATLLDRSESKSPNERLSPAGERLHPQHPARLSSESETK
jgi:DNA-binding MarR family transcriptional regulator